MRAHFILLSGLFCLTAVAFVPEEAYATGRYFNSVLVASVPCISAMGPSLYVTTKPGPTTFLTPLIYTPFTLGNLIPPIPSIPPTVPGSQIAGIADIPFSCMIGKVPVFGWRMQTVRGGLIPLNPAAFFGV